MFHQVNVVKEDRLYPSWSTKSAKEIEQQADPQATTNLVGIDHGIIRGRKILNDLHVLMGLEGYSQVSFTRYYQYTGTKRNFVNRKTC